MYPAEKKKKEENKSTCCLLQCFYLGAAGWELGAGSGSGAAVVPMEQKFF
jgi:hypothetical protein